MMLKPPDIPATLARSAAEARGRITHTAEIVDAEWRRLVAMIDRSESVPGPVKQVTGEVRSLAASLVTVVSRSAAQIGISVPGRNRCGHETQPEDTQPAAATVAEVTQPAAATVAEDTQPAAATVAEVTQPAPAAGKGAKVARPAARKAAGTRAKTASGAAPGKVPAGGAGQDGAD